jgi:hypothetical protein
MMINMTVSPKRVITLSNSHYMENTVILKIQDLFAKADLVNGANLPFTQILDKGYRIIRVA